MSDQDEDPLEKLKKLKNKKDILEQRMTYFEARRNFLETSLLNAITIDKSNSILSVPSVEHLNESVKKGKGHCLKDSLTTILKWVRINERRDRSITRPVKQDIEKSLTDAIKWTLQTNPEEEDLVLRTLLKESLAFLLNWVKDLNVNQSEKVQKQNLVDTLMNAGTWASKSNQDDEIMRYYLTEYLIIASNWTKHARKKNNTTLGEIKYNVKVSGEENRNDTEELDDNEMKIAQQELIEYLKAIMDWAKSIDVKRDERDIQRELLESLTITMHWVTTGAASQEVEITKKLLQEILSISVNWAIIVDEDVGDDLKQRLIDNLLFAINWVASYETKGNDEVTRELLRQTLSTAIEWKMSIDRQGQA